MMAATPFPPELKHLYTDWGLSRVIAESKSSSQYGFSPVYAAPEQVSSKKFGKPDERTDIYQLGVIFYNLLTLGDVKEALKFAFDLKNYAQGDVRKDVDALVEGLKYRVESGLRIDEEMFGKMEVVLHQVKMG